MGCSQSSEQQSIKPSALNSKQIHPQNRAQEPSQISPKINKQEIHPHETRSQSINDVAQWEKFSQKQEAECILSKQILEIEDLEFLLKNKLWKDQWLMEAYQMFNIPKGQLSSIEESMMQLYFLLKLKQAKILQSEYNEHFDSQSENAQSQVNLQNILCKICYNDKMKKFKIPSQYINQLLFRECSLCSGQGWIASVQQNQNPHNQNLFCSNCQQSIPEISIEQECNKCQAIGYLWIGSN